MIGLGFAFFVQESSEDNLFFFDRRAKLAEVRVVAAVFLFVEALDVVKQGECVAENLFVGDVEGLLELRRSFCRSLRR